jgi:hypothetical protein
MNMYIYTDALTTRAKGRRRIKSPVQFPASTVKNIGRGLTTDPFAESYSAFTRTTQSGPNLL